MPGSDLTFWDYLKETFHFKVRVPALGYLSLNKWALMAFAAAGFVNPGFWFIGAGGEIAYLLFLSGSPRMQKVIQGRRLLVQGRSEEAKLRMELNKLSPKSVERYRRLTQKSREILNLAPDQEDAPIISLDKVRSDTLNQLLFLFMKLLMSADHLGKSLNRVGRKELMDKAAQLERRLAGMDQGSPLAKSLLGTLDIQRKRLQTLDKAEQSMQIVEAELQRIEQQVELLREEAAMINDPEMLSMKLDSVSGLLNETSNWVNQNSEFFRSIGHDDILNPDSGLPPPMPGLQQKE